MCMLYKKIRFIKSNLSTNSKKIEFINEYLINT